MFENTNFIWCGMFSSESEWIHPDVEIDSWEAIMVISGTVYIRIGDRHYEVNKDGVLLMPPGIRHAGTKTSTGVSFYWIHFDDCPLKEMHIERCEGHHLSLLFRQALHFCVDLARNAEACNYLGRLILLELHTQSSKTIRNRTVYEVAEWIRIHDDQPLKTRDVAEHFRYNPDYLNRLFRQEFGKSLKSYIDQVRMGRIKNMLLNTSLSVQEIAEQCGFKDYKHFLKFFKHHQKISPKEFRNTYYYIHINNS